MIRFFKHEVSLLTFTVEWWDSLFIVTVFYPYGDPVGRGTPFHSMASAITYASKEMDDLHRMLEWASI